MEAVKPPVVRATSGQAITRREFAVIAAAGLVAVRQPASVAIGVQSYSFRDRSLDQAIAAMQKLGLRGCELWQSHIEPRQVRRDELRRWRETVSLDAFRRVRDQFARAKVALTAYNISIKDDFSDAELERADRARGGTAQDVRSRSQSLAHRSQRVCHREEPDRRDVQEPLDCGEPRHRALHRGE
jgi:hypothetical protein